MQSSVNAAVTPSTKWIHREHLAVAAVAALSGLSFPHPYLHILAVDRQEHTNSLCQA